MWPDFEETKGDPRGSKDIGDGYLLLGPKDTSAYDPSPPEQTAIDSFFSCRQNIHQGTLYRWGRLKIPSGQIARSRWKELERCSDMARADRNVKVRGLILLKVSLYALMIPQILHNDVIHFAEVRFCFIGTSGEETQAFALVSLYSPPNEYLLQRSHTTLAVCLYRDEAALMVIDAKSITSVVAMVPFPYTIDGCSNQYFMIEHVGLDVVEEHTDAQEDVE